MNIEYIAQQIVNGLILGSMYAMVAIGFSMIYGIIRLINSALSRYQSKILYSNFKRL